MSSDGSVYFLKMKEYIDGHESSSYELNIKNSGDDNKKKNFGNSIYSLNKI